MIEVDHIADHSNFVSAEQVAEVIQRQYVIGIHLASVGASIGGTLLLLAIIMLIAATIHSCCYGGQCCGCFWWALFKCICGRCDHEEETEDGGKIGSNDNGEEFRDPRLDDEYFTKFYMSKPAAQYRWPEEGKRNLPYDSGDATSGIPLPVTVQSPGGGARTLQPSDYEDIVTADPITIAGPRGVPPNTPESTYTGASSRRQSMSRFGAISRSPSMPSLREEKIENGFATMPRNAGRLRQQQALINASRRASIVSGGGFSETVPGSLNLDVTGRRVSYAASMANDFGGTEVKAAANLNEAAKAAKVEVSASAKKEDNGFLEPF